MEELAFPSQGENPLSRKLQPLHTAIAAVSLPAFQQSDEIDCTEALECPNKDNMIEIPSLIGHIWTMIKTSAELTGELGAHIRRRRTLMGWTQQDAAKRAGVAYRTWRRLEAEGAASIEDLIKAAVAMRCEAGLNDLFPAPAATSLDNLLAQQAADRSALARGRPR